MNAEIVKIINIIKGCRNDSERRWDVGLEDESSRWFASDRDNCLAAYDAALEAIQALRVDDAMDALERAAHLEAVYGDAQYVHRAVTALVERVPSAVALLSPEMLDCIAEESPWSVMPFAADRLTQARIDALASSPIDFGSHLSLVLRYASHRLTDAQFDRCASHAQTTALIYVSDRLTARQLDWCAESAPWYALEYAASRLTPERLDYCAARYPHRAMKYDASRLTSARLDWAASRCPTTALHYAAHLLSPERLDWCASQSPRAALRYAAHLLTPERRAACQAAIA